MQPKCIMIHGCPGDEERAMNEQTRTYDKHWMPWLERRLTGKGFEVKRPMMPEPWNPDYDKFKDEFANYPVDENTTLIGHSCGCSFLVRWLGDSKQKIDKLILVAPWKIPEPENELRDKFYTYPIDKTITERVNKIVMFTSDDEEEDGKISLKMYKKDLGGEIVELKNHGHFCFGDMGTEEFPELLEKIIS